MAINATVTPNLDEINHIPGDLRESIVTLTVGAADTYVTGGFAVPPSLFGFTSIKYCDIYHSLGYAAYFNAATGNIQVFSAAGTELANASAALQSTKFVLQAVGR